MIEFQVRGRVALITINRPEARNAINGVVASGLQEAVERLESDDELWAGIIAGHGPVFSAGADLKEIAAGNVARLVTKPGGFGDITRLPRVLPRNVAMELAITGDPITAERAYALGLVNVLCEPGTAVESALALADRICVNAPVAVQLSRAIVLDGMLADDAEAWRITDAATRSVMETEDFSEGPKAFIEKREPVWTGR